MTLDTTGAARAHAVITAMNTSALTSDEVTAITQQLQVFFAADTQYLIGNTVVLPGTMNNPAGQAVQVAVPAGTGTTSAPEPIAGKGIIS
jgi:hypothetical protein